MNNPNKKFMRVYKGASGFHEVSIVYGVMKCKYFYGNIQ